MRIYVVTVNGAERLVEANVPSQAIMHAAAELVAVRPAKPADVARVMGAGGKVEQIAGKQIDIEGV